MKKLLLFSLAAMVFACGQQPEASKAAASGSLSAETAERGAGFQFLCYSPNNIDDLYRLKIESFSSAENAVVSLLDFEGGLWQLAGTPVHGRLVVVPAPEGDDVRFISDGLFIIVQPYQRPAPGIHSGKYLASIRGELPPRLFQQQTEISCDDLVKL